MPNRSRNRAAACTAACLLLGAPAAGLAQKSDAAKATSTRPSTELRTGSGQGYPNRPVRIVVPFTPGGQPDIVSRLIAPRLTEALGQQVIVDNRPGAGSMIGSRIVASANADGHTLLSISAAHVVTPAVRAKLGYDTDKDFAGVTMTGNAAYYGARAPQGHPGGADRDHDGPRAILHGGRSGATGRPQARVRGSGSSSIAAICSRSSRMRSCQ